MITLNKNTPEKLPTNFPKLISESKLIRKDLLLEETPTTSEVMTDIEEKNT